MTTMAVLHTADFRVCLFIYTILVLVLCYSSCDERQLVARVNPGCPPERCSNDSMVEVVHVRADGPNDTVHYIWCFHGKPTILTALTTHATNLSVSWDDFPNTTSSIYFTPQPIYSFGVSVKQIFEFNDVNDTGVLDMSNNNSSYIHTVEIPETWTMKHFQQNLDSVLLIIEGSWRRNGSFVKDGTLRFELETYRKQGHGSKLPHLLHSTNATQMELSFLNMVTNSGFQQSRYAVELVMAANESAQSSIVNSSFQSLDDEHAPGVFTLVDLQTTASSQGGNGGYLQWRPVAYVADERGIVNSTETNLYHVKNVTSSSSQLEGSLLAAYFGSNLGSNLLSAVNVSFGSEDDGFYSKNNASIWAVTIGYGHPPNENFSLMVILIMSICLGLPAILIVLSGFYIALRRISYSKDDLLLNE